MRIWFTHKFNEFKCGIAIGFPPYQYQNDKNEPIGIDAEITKLVLEKSNKKVIFTQDKWDELMAKLYHGIDNIDFLCGAEISDERKKLYDFSIPYYDRKIVIFVLDSSSIKKLDDLTGKKITGDRHSFIERQMGDNKNKFRLIKTASKEESFEYLKSGKVEAVIAPLEVGNYIVKKAGLKTRVLDGSDPGSPVAFAVKKGDSATLAVINDSLKKLIESGKIAEILKKYQ